MAEFLVIFLIVAAGSLVRWSIDMAFKRLAIRATRETLEVVSKGAWTGVPAGGVDPIVRVGFILAGYGAIVLALVSAVPGALALERTALAFALLCAGGLVGEISGAGVTPQTSESDDVPPRAERGGETSRPLSVALALTLNVSIAWLTAGQGLIPLVPHAATTRYPDRLDAVIVVAKRTHDPLDEQSGNDRSGF